MKFLPLAFLLGCTTTDADLANDINSVHQDLTEINTTLNTVLQILNACEADPNCTLTTTTTDTTDAATAATSTGDATNNAMPLVSTPATTTRTRDTTRTRGTTGNRR